MKVEAVPAATRARRPVPADATASRSWACELLARLLCGLLQRPVSDQEILHKAVGLGLLRQPSPGRSGELDTRSTARLLLTGYQLPAHIEEGSLLLLQAHLASGRRAWVVLRNETHTETTVYQVSGLASTSLLLREVGARFVVEQRLPADDFMERWTTAGSLLVVAATAWSDLPATGALFFGGLRDLDGSYHWVAAECDTDRHGRILRY